MPTGTEAGSRDMEAGAYRYQRHQPENNLLYRIVERYYPEFAAYLAEQGAVLLVINNAVHGTSQVFQLLVVYSVALTVQGSGHVHALVQIGINLTS